MVTGTWEARRTGSTAGSRTQPSSIVRKTTGWLVAMRVMSGAEGPTAIRSTFGSGGGGNTGSVSVPAAAAAAGLSWTTWTCEQATSSPLSAVVTRTTARLTSDRRLVECIDDHETVRVPFMSSWKSQRYLYVP